MRIIGGKFRGKRFSPPTNFKARPTTDFAKEAIFNILSNMYNFENVDILDLFSGTGSISFEFGSRNTKSIVAVESNYNHAKYIEKQFENLNLTNAVVYKTDVFRYLKTCKQKFDIVFADPPYDMENIENIYHAVFENNILSNTSVFVLEHPGSYDFSNFPHFTSLKKYGSVHFSIFEPSIVDL